MNLPVHLLVDVERPADRLVVGGVEAEAASDLLRQQTHHRLQLLFHDAGHVGPRFEKVLEIRRRKYQHLSGAVVAKIVVALARFQHAGRVLEIGQLRLRLLCKEIVGNPHGQLAILV